MRCRIVVAAGLVAFSATGAQAQEWCGYAAKENAVNRMRPHHHGGLPNR